MSVSPHGVAIALAPEDAELARALANRFDLFALPSEDDASPERCACDDCATLEARDWQRQRLISRLKTRMLALGGHLCDEFHPWGRCTCGGAGACSWCESTCLGCGGVPHEGDCPELSAAMEAAAPICRFCYCCRNATCLVDGPDGTVVDCTYDERLGACTGCLSETPFARGVWQRRLLLLLREQRDGIR